MCKPQSIRGTTHRSTLSRHIHQPNTSSKTRTHMKPSHMFVATARYGRTRTALHSMVITSLHAGEHAPLLLLARSLVALAFLCTGCSSGTTAESSAPAPSEQVLLLGEASAPQSAKPASVAKPDKDTPTPMKAAPPAIPKVAPPAPTKTENSSSRNSLKLDTRVSVLQFVDAHPKSIEFFSHDPDFKNYMRDYWSTWVESQERFFEELNTMHSLWYSEQRMKRVEHSEDITEVLPETYQQVKSLFKSAWSVGKAARDGMSLLRLEKKREALLGSYSNEKQDWAMGMELLMNSVIHDAYYAPLNEEMKAIRAGKHFRNISDDVLVDSDAQRYLERLRDDMIKLQGKYRTLHSTILMNKVLDKKVSYPELSSTMQRIMRSNDPVDYRFQPQMVHSFVRDFERLRLELLEADNKERFRTGQWSAAKRKNFNMVVGDIKKRMNTMAKEVNAPFLTRPWDPWASSKR